MGNTSLTMLAFDGYPKSIGAAAACYASYDVVKDLTIDFPIERYLRGDAHAAAREAYGLLLQGFGSPQSAHALPAWVTKKWPRDHWVGLLDKEQVRALAAAFASTQLDALVVEVARGNASHIRGALDFIKASAEAGRWVLSVESGS